MTIFSAFTRIASLFQATKEPVDPSDYYTQTKNVLSAAPLIDGHNDLPHLIHVEMRNKLHSRLDLKQNLLGHTDIQ